MNRVSHFAPAIDLILRIDPRRILIALRLWRNLRGFGNQQSSGSTLGIIRCCQLAWYQPRTGPITRQGSHHDVVGKGYRAKIIGLK
ncbi:hypothetical protein D3C80_1236610 [compost metagenome]